MACLYVTYRIFISIIWMSFVVVRFYDYPLLAFALLALNSFFDFVISICIRPFKSTKDNSKLVFENFLFLILFLVYFPIAIGSSETVENVCGYFVLSMIILLCVEGFVFRMIGYKGI